MGSSPIIFIGQDLSFRNDGHTHAEGTTFDKDVMDMSSGNLVSVSGNAEDTVYTTHVFLSTLRWMEEAIERTKAYCINSTEGDRGVLQGRSVF
jgi:hypothetical protein